VPSSRVKLGTTSSSGWETRYGITFERAGRSSPAGTWYLLRPPRSTGIAPLSTMLFLSLPFLFLFFSSSNRRHNANFSPRHGIISVGFCLLTLARTVLLFRTSRSGQDRRCSDVGVDAVPYSVLLSRSQGSRFDLACMRLFRNQGPNSLH